jgi:hypothetical protein
MHSDVLQKWDMCESNSSTIKKPQYLSYRVPVLNYRGIVTHHKTVRRWSTENPKWLTKIKPIPTTDYTAPCEVMRYKVIPEIISQMKRDIKLKNFEVVYKRYFSSINNRWLFVKLCELYNIHLVY